MTAAFIAHKSEKYFRRQSEVRGEQTALINEMIEGQRVVQAFHQEDSTLERFEEINGRLQFAGLRAVFYSSLTNPVTRFVNSMVYAGVALAGALYAGPRRNHRGADVQLFGYANQYTKPFNEISGVVTELQNALTWRRPPVPAAGRDRTGPRRPGGVRPARGGSHWGGDAGACGLPL